MRSSCLFSLISIPVLLQGGAFGQMLLNGPIEGFVFDAPSHGFRAVQGFPGSASLGPALSAGFDYGSVAPRKNYAIAFEKSHIKFVSGLGTGHASVSSIAAVQSKAEGVAWSGDGSTAAIYSRTGNWMQLLTGFPATAAGCGAHACLPAVVESVDVSAMQASLSTVALDEHGTRVALGAAGDHAGVYLSANRRGFALVLQTAHPTALSFSDDAAVLYTLDESNDLSAVNLGNFSFQTRPLTGLVDAFALKFGHDAAGRVVLYIASRKNRIFRTYDPATHRSVSDIALSFVPAGIDELGTKSFLLRSRTKDGDPLWLFSSAPRRAVYFVPVPPPGGNGQ